MENKILTLSEAKQWLRLEEDYEEEDQQINLIINSVTSYLDMSVNKIDFTNEKQLNILKIPALAMLADMYENRVIYVDTRKNNLRHLVNSAIIQASYV